MVIKSLEKDIQRAIVNFLKIYSRKGTVIEYKQIARVNPHTGKRFFASVYPGVSDMMWFAAGGKTAFLECKTEKGRQSDHQIEFQKKMESLGYEYRIVRSIDDVLDLVGQ